MYDPARYYKPYISDESDVESDSDTESMEGGYISEESLLEMSGTDKHPPVLSEVYDDANITWSPPTAKFATRESRNTSLFMINSRDRDTTVYPQPTFFTIRLPRTFRNIKQINLSQLNLLNSFFNFTKEKGNTYMYVYEQGRAIKDPVTGADISNAVRIQIRNGTYTADDLVTELNNALNSTPLFSDLTLGDFINVFQSTGNYAIMFNTPGPIVFNSLTQTYDRNQTINNIVARYFTVIQNVGTVSFSYNQCLVAYYYPVIKEMIIESGTPTFSTVGQDIPIGFVSWYDYLVFSFQGLDDPYVTAIVNDPANQTMFNQYRFERTFNYFLVNKYVCTYNTKQGRLVVTAPSLNDSIATDLNTQYNAILNDLVKQSNFVNVADFQNQYTNINNSNGALIELYNFIQTRFTSNFGVNFGTYTAEFYSDSNNQIELYNTLNKYGWNLSLTPQVSASSISSNVPAPQVPIYWSNVQISQANAAASNIEFVSTIGVPEFIMDELVFANAGETTFGYVDISFAIVPTTYNRVAFHTRCRQSISLMTIPRYLNERGPGTEIVYDFGSTITQTPILFESEPPYTDTYVNIDISGNPLFNMYNVTQTMFFSADYMRAYDEWLNYMSPQILLGNRVQDYDLNFGQRPPTGDIGLTSYRPFQYFQVNADQYLVEPNARFRITFYAETQTGTNFPVPIVITWYKDRAGFMADAQQDLIGSLSFENPRHYFQRQVYGTTTGSAEMTVYVNNMQQTYFMVHVQDRSVVPGSIPLRVFAVLTDTYGDYVHATDLDRLDMPYAGLPPLADQFTPDSSVYKDPLKSIYDSNVFKLCYDLSGVSNNLLDYVIQTGSNIYYDPKNVGDHLDAVSTGLRYQFQLNTNGSSIPPPNVTNWSLYFGSNSSNLIRDSYNLASNIYLSSLQTPRFNSSLLNEFTLTNWFQAGNTNLRETYMTPAIDTTYATKISTTSVFLPCINASAALPSDSYTDEAFPDISGIAGMSFFLPPNQVVRLNEFVMKFAYMQPSTDSAGTLYTRSNSPLVLGGTDLTQAIYNNQQTEINTSKSPPADWDDWYTYNRRNLKLAIFNTGDISGASPSTLSISTALATMTLQKVTQVGNYQNKLGTLRTREPEWGTYYTYTFDQSSNIVWNPDIPWTSTITTADYAPVYMAGDSMYSNYFLTHPFINNYTFLPRSIGLAPAVGNAVYNPYTLSNYVDDIPNSYTAVPFYWDSATNDWRVGSFYGLSYTTKPAMPDPALIGAAAPYYGPPGIYAWTQNSSNVLGLTNGLSTMYTPFYFNTKINYNQLDMRYDPATDLSMFGGFSSISTEYQDTMLFLYENAYANDDLGDISTVTTSGDYWKWGCESNASYIAYDDQGGYNFLSYIHDITIRPVIPEYAVHVRAYDPIPGFNTGLRVIGKNYTDFGTPSLWEIVEEISTLGPYTPITDAQANGFINSWVNSNDYGAYNSTISTNNFYRDNAAFGNFFSHEYADALINFNTTFITSNTFGKTLTYAGLPLSFSSYGHCLVQYIDLFNSIRSVFVGYNNILSTATGQLNEYVVDRYSNILPPSVLNRNRYTDPLPFEFLFKSKLVPPYDTMYDNWGLGYNLGFNKRDTTPAKTTIVSDTFIRITQDYIYLRLNPEFNVNTMSVSSKENFQETREARSEEQKYFSKIILNNFGSFCRTAVQLPKQFNPVLGKYDTISCQLVDANGAQISSIDCEYDFVLEVTEITNGPTDDSTLMKPTDDLEVYKS